MFIFDSLKKTASNIPGWHTNRKIIVIESDDWGSIRIPSRRVFKKLQDNGLNLKGVDALRYSLYDSLETSTDLESLFQIIDSIRDFRNSPAVFTAVCVVANPDFEKIKESGFQQYYYEPFTETLRKYYNNEKAFTLWKDGIRNHLFMPQFHGREHLNVSRWMKALRANDSEAHLAFDEGTWAFLPKIHNNDVPDYVAAFQLSSVSDLEIHEKIIKSGLVLFEELFGYKAQYFVPPNGIINNKLNLICSKNGIKYRSVSKIQRESIGNGRTKSIFHWLGQKDKNGIRYITRNCVFEPSQPGKDWVDSCLNDIEIAFRWNDPAIIGTHRVNFIGVHDTSNRDIGLMELKRLLTTIKKIWLDVEFMTTDELGSLINSESNS
jgi:hypothetical protein